MQCWQREPVKNINKIFRIIFITIALIRLSLLFLLLFFSKQTISIYSDNFHHYYIGLLLCFLALFKFNKKIKIILLGVGLGLIIDEIMLPLYLLNIWHQDYWSFLGMIPVFIALLTIEIFTYLKNQSPR